MKKKSNKEEIEKEFHMPLYHGSNVEAKSSRLLQNQRELDFGRGFYTTSDIEQAKCWAKRTTQRVKQKQSYVFVYEISDPQLL